MADEKATTRRDATQVSGIEQPAPDAALAVNAADLRTLLAAVDAHLSTAAGSDETAIALKAARDRLQP